MKKVAYFTVANYKELHIVYEDNSFAIIDLCAMFGLEMAEEKENESNND